jgi:hypothetical protein
VPDIPSNMEEFNTIAGLIFAQLYKAFPVRIDLLDRPAIAKSMGISGDWTVHKLPSGRTFANVLAHTISWLTVENYINSSGGHPAAQVALSSKGLVAMNAVPPGLKQSLGSELTKAVGDGSTPGVATKIAEVMGAFAGSFTKSFTADG